MEKPDWQNSFFASKNSFLPEYIFITVKCCYTVYIFLTGDWHTDNDSTAVKQSDMNDGAMMAKTQP